MTIQEFSEEFDILYDNIRTNTARGLDEYEKSVFLTQAQEILVKGYYNNRLEGNEERRRELANLIKTMLALLLSILMIIFQLEVCSLQYQRI